MSDDQKKDQLPEAFDDAAGQSVEAGIADETAAYDKAIKDGETPKSPDHPSADEMGDFA